MKTRIYAAPAVEGLTPAPVTTELRARPSLSL